MCVVYKLDDLISLLEELQKRGFRGVIIGSTVISLELREKKFEDDVDFFAFEPSPLIEEDTYRSWANELGWEMTYTELGTPRLIARVGGTDIVLEFYENIHDFYVPPEMLERAPAKKLKKVEIKVLKPEDYIVLKAKAGRDEDMEDLQKIRELINMGKLKIDERLVKEAINMLPEEDQKLTIKRLKQLGFRL